MRRKENIHYLISLSIKITIIDLIIVVRVLIADLLNLHESQVDLDFMGYCWVFFFLCLSDYLIDQFESQLFKVTADLIVDQKYYTKSSFFPLLIKYFLFVMVFGFVGLNCSFQYKQTLLEEAQFMNIKFGHLYD